MQATWFELSSGRAYLAKGEVGPALKRLLRVDAHFGDFQEDQFDFHGYCIRKQVGASRVWCMASVCVGEGGGGLPRPPCAGGLCKAGWGKCGP